MESSVLPERMLKSDEFRSKGLIFVGLFRIGRSARGRFSRICSVLKGCKVVDKIRGVSKLDLKPISLFDQRVSTSNLKLSLGPKSNENSIYTRFRNHFSKYINSQYVIFSFDICKSNINENVNRVHFCQIHAYRYLLDVHSIQELNILTLNMLFGYVNRNVNRVHFYVYL